MIYELLSTALLAVSMGSLKPDMPKRSFGSYSSLNGTISIGILDNKTIHPDIGFALNGYSGSFDGISKGNQSYTAGDGHDEFFDNEWDYSNLGGDSYVSGTLTLYVSEQEVFNLLVSDFGKYSTFSNGAYSDDFGGNGFNGQNYVFYASWTADIAQETADFSFDIVLNLPNLTTYNVTKNFTNCHWSGTTNTNIPDTYTEATRSNPYTYTIEANTGCYFKTDGSGIVASGGLEIVSIDYGNYPTISHLRYTTDIKITLNLPLADCSLSLTAVAFSVQEINDLYGDGFEDAKAIYGENVQFNWIKTTFDGMAGFFNIQILPNISLGFLMFAPIVVVAIVAIVRIIKHE